MADKRDYFTNVGFTKAFILPALCVFLVPVLSLLFFKHHQTRFDQDIQKQIIANVRADSTLSDKDRAEGISYFESTPYSTMLLNKEFASNARPEVRSTYSSFHWMIRISAWSIIASIVVFLWAGVCVAMSLHSPMAQYFGLSFGWHALRIFGALQTLAQGILLVALTYWISALWLKILIPKLIILVACCAGVSAFSLTKAIFKKIPKSLMVQDGKILEFNMAERLWERLRSLCQMVGTEPPNNLIAGIDDNFYVTESRMAVAGIQLEGRSLYISLAMLKHLTTSEADAVLAHEMAHFSGKDTTYSRKIAPLLQRYENYLRALDGGLITLPIFSFMMLFRVLFELSLGKVRRDREYRADRVASDVTSTNALAGALLRITAYSRYRSQVETELLNQDKKLETANVSERISMGFADFLRDFSRQPDLGTMTTAHPFDSHPPISSRLKSLGIDLVPSITQSWFEHHDHESWYESIDGAAEIEREQWAPFESAFREYQQKWLAFRLDPQTDEERLVVVQSFPDVLFENHEGSLAINYQNIQHSTWPEPLPFAEINELTSDPMGNLFLKYQRNGALQIELIRAQRYENPQLVFDTINNYYSRARIAAGFANAKPAE